MVKLLLYLAFIIPPAISHCRLFHFFFFSHSHFPRHTTSSISSSAISPLFFLFISAISPTSPTSPTSPIFLVLWSGVRRETSTMQVSHRQRAEEKSMIGT
ncbi:hypothetical protein Dimus_000346 [Dionaea muscipula]